MLAILSTNTIFKTTTIVTFTLTIFAFNSKKTVRRLAFVSRPIAITVTGPIKTVTVIITIRSGLTSRDDGYLITEIE